GDARRRRPPEHDRDIPRRHLDPDAAPRREQAPHRYEGRRKDQRPGRSPDRTQNESNSEEPDDQQRSEYRQIRLVARASYEAPGGLRSGDIPEHWRTLRVFRRYPAQGYSTRWAAAAAAVS